ncbi:MAG: efflux RND transporter periplasmic adaptor subunit [Alcanivoracaceae bacterium]
MTTPPTDQRLLALSSLIQFEQEVRDVETLRDLGYVAVNDSRRVVDFRQACLWHEDDLRRVRIHSASNVSEVDPNTPFIRGMAAIASWATTHLAHDKAQIFSITEQDQPGCGDALRHLAGNLVFVPLTSRSGALAGGMIFAADRQWREADLALLGIIGKTISHAWHGLSQPGGTGKVIQHLRQYWRRYLITAAVLFLMPVRQYVLAPAEVVPQKPLIVAAPMVGVIEAVTVEPNEAVAEGQLLFRMEDIDLENKRIIALRSVEVAEADYLRNAQGAFDCTDCLARVPELRAVLARERAVLAWAEEQLAMANVRSPATGVVTFTDVNDIVGRPVDTGQRVMTVSDPGMTRLKILLPVDDAIALDLGAEVVFYPSTNPLNRYLAELQSASYEPVTGADQVLGFTLLAGFREENHPRLGLRGTAKIYGGRAPLIYHALRKPLSWLRRTIGF